MTEISVIEATHNFGTLLEKVKNAPVNIEQDGEVVAVLVSAQEFEQGSKKRTASLERKERAFSAIQEWAKKKEIKISKRQIRANPKIAHLVKKHVLS